MPSPFLEGRVQRVAPAAESPGRGPRTAHEKLTHPVVTELCTYRKHFPTCSNSTS